MSKVSIKLVSNETDVVVCSGFRVFQAIAREGDCRYSTEKRLLNGKPVWLATFKNALERQVYLAAQRYAGKHGLSQNGMLAAISIINDPAHPYNVRLQLETGLPKAMFV